MGRADVHELGLCPLLTISPRMKEDKKFDNYNGVTLTLPTALDCNEKGLKNVKFSVVPDCAIHTDLGTIGRGTTIVPVKPTGRAATLFGSRHLIAKIAWPIESRHGEDMLIRKIRRKLKEKKKTEYLRHVVDLRCSLSQTMDQVALPRAFMDDLPVLENFEKRVLRCLVMEEYSPLESIQSVDEFKTIFVDTVKAHHWVYETSGILHRDISVSNIMYHREAGISGRVRGVLCDWDLAYDPENPYPHQPATLQANATSHVIADEIIIEKRETGTGPFMAIDLLTEGKVPFHLYRHDLESFFFVLVWFCAVFDPAAHTLGHFKTWESADLVYIGYNKRAFLRQGPTQRKVFRQFDSAYEPLVALWIEGLVDLFRVVNVTELDKQENWEILKIRAETNGNAREREECNEQMRAVRKARDELVTYEKFMKCLRVDVTADR